jgi:hypothetical protein
LYDNVALPTVLNVKILDWADHVAGADVSRKVTGGRFRGRRPVGKPRGRCKGVVLMDAVDLLQTHNCKAPARNTEG